MAGFLNFCGATAFGLLFLASYQLYGIAGFLVSIVACSIYLLPSIIAHYRKPDNWLGVFTLNILLGWSFIGWVGALVWACSGKSERLSG